MTVIPFDTHPVRRRQASQSKLRGIIGLALLVLTVGTQLVWSLAFR